MSPLEQARAEVTWPPVIVWPADTSEKLAGNYAAAIRHYAEDFGAAMTAVQVLAAREHIDRVLRQWLKLSALTPPDETETLTVQQVACIRGGLIYTMPRPARHSDVMRWANQNGHDGPFQPEEQGFLLSNGAFANRALAYRIARAAGQPWRRRPEVEATDHLFTEDLW